METIFIQLEKPPPGMNHARSVEGRAVAQNWDKLTVMARDLAVKPLQDFMAGSPTSKGPDAWYSPTDGLTTIRKLIPRISADKRGLNQVRLLIHDLHNYENILSAAGARGSKFRFADKSEL